MINASTKLKKLLAVLLCAVMVLGTTGLTAFASGAAGGMRGYTYIDENGQQKTLPNTVTTIDVTSSLTTWNVNNAWYIVSGEVTISGSVYAEGSVCLLLLDGSSLTVNQGIVINSSNTLRIYAQSQGEERGRLTIFGRNFSGNNDGTGTAANAAGIYAGGTLIINGGMISATGGYVRITSPNYGIANFYGSGIGGGCSDKNNPTGFGSITINGGVIEAYGGKKDYTYYGAGIGGGKYSSNEGSITINGGTVYAEGRCGIGYGSEGVKGIMLTVNGGDITAVGYEGVDCGNDVVLNNSTFIAAASSGEAIYGKNVLICDSEVEAKSTANGYGIYGTRSVSLTNSTVTAAGGSGYPGIQATESITIEGGNITAQAGSGSYGMQAPQISLGWEDRYHDRISCSSYSGTVTFTDEFVLADMFNQATDVIATPSNINGQVIMPDPITEYIDENGQVQSRRDFFLLESMDGGELELQEYWYLVCDDVDILNTRVTVDGSAHIVLVNGKELNVDGGFSVTEGNELSIYAQPHESVDEIGALTVSGVAEGCAGIGGDGANDCGTVGIYGGRVTVEGGANAPAIGVSGTVNLRAGVITLLDGAEYGTVEADVINIGIVNAEDSITAYGLYGTVNVAKALMMLDEDGAVSLRVIDRGTYDDFIFSPDVTAVIYVGLVGDVNCDGEVTMADVSALIAYLMNSGSLTEIGGLNADANCDGEVDILDATAIYAIAFGS